jgi:hypothetical protein
MLISVLPRMPGLNIYGFSQTKVRDTTVFGRLDCGSQGAHVPSADFSALASRSAQCCTSSVRSASTITRAFGSVPE